MARGWSGTPYDYSHNDATWKQLDRKPAGFDCSTFVCRIAMEALGYAPDILAANARWLLDNFVEVDSLAPGDLVGYGRAADADEYLAGHDVIWHAMIYLGTGMVIGACDIAGEVTTLPIEYHSELGHSSWKLIDPPFRSLLLRPPSAPIPLAALALRKRRA